MVAVTISALFSIALILALGLLLTAMLQSALPQLRTILAGPVPLQAAPSTPPAETNVIALRRPAPRALMPAVGWRQAA
ncbi:hypothetical protein [Sandaracinobacteroides saxicola]|uniref:Uncharacterized protein n=1 Tax=Sandaracinobacteroides saxicola TaxID=2759707 RepID=A0A7G5ILB2_9SPHN|nr:hypothetical protein [Sandaracinobacteroides saxicola]QMW24154.1 hypothetical protein H3309_06780 [Sandaracinobacteroides saxicola]